MSIVKSIAVGNGDMFYIKHGADSFTTIDCCMTDENRESIMEEIIAESKDKGISRFISTHPDDDHIQNIEYYNQRKEIINFYCVENKAKKEEETDSFKKYKEIRDSDKAYYVYKGCKRKWLNLCDDERGRAGLSFLWPDVNNEDYKEALKKANEGKSPNNISLIVQYNCGAKFLWLGDIETDFLDKIKDEIDFDEIDVLFAPHHGRKSGKISEEILEILNPQVVIIGEAESKDLNYYSNYNTITQNTAGDIIFECEDEKINIYVGNENYSVDFLKDYKKSSYENYIGTLDMR